MLKPEDKGYRLIRTTQPPSGGCVLKRAGGSDGRAWRVPAAFGRLCVETHDQAMRRLYALPAAFGRLCVETKLINTRAFPVTTSRLRAAVC